jgi:hypothetical protein
MPTATLRQLLTLGLLAGGLLGAAPALAGSFSMTSTWDQENTRRMVTEALPKQSTDVDIVCQTMNRSVGNDLSRCGASYRQP